MRTTTTTPAIDEVAVVATDGTPLRLRPIRPEDADALVAFHSRLSLESTYYRFFAVHPRLSPREVDRFTHVDDHDRVALVAAHGDRIVGVGRYDRLRTSTDAEVAFVVEDAYQGRGICTLLLRQLARIAVRDGIERFVAQVLPGNNRMLAVFRHSGLEESSRMTGDVVDVVLGLRPLASGGEPWS
jgi:RimJ/RimL family protein N-acetyltransferase